jgi:outer membrane protein insertion porin family
MDKLHETEPSFPATHEAHMILRSRSKSSLLFPLMIVSAASTSFAQMGGGAPGGDNAPAFSDPKFKDRLYESGGPRGRQATDGVPILSVGIEGNSTVSENFIVSVMQSRVDRTFDKETFNRDISALHRTNLFKTIRPYFSEIPEGVHIRLLIEERPIIREVYFRGNERVEDRELKKHAGVQKGDALDPISVNSAKSRLIELYQEKGMNQIDVQVVSGHRKGDRDVEFIINEGPVERINRISFVGNKAFGSDLLKARIKSHDARGGITSYLYNLASDFKIANDRDGLMGYYRSLGYFDARVEFRKDYNQRGDFVDVTFIVSEGQRYTIKSVSIAGTKRYQPSELLPFMKIKAGDPFLQVHKSQDEKLLRDVYGAQGHIFADVIGELVYQPNNQVDIIYNIGEGDIYRASEVRVHIEGDHTKERVIMQPLGKIRPGSVIDGPELEDGERRLKGLQIFNVDPSQGAVPNIQVDRGDEPSSDAP